MTPERIATTCAPHHLAVMGSLDAAPGDALPDGTRTIVLLGPHEPGFWAHVNTAPEFHDSAPDPMDRWSMRVIDGLAMALGGSALFPFGGPPWHPFIGWAKRTGRAWDSPVGLLVHDTAGLFVSFRGALALPFALEHTTATNPCEGCARPCLDACPVDALTETGYDISACRTFIAAPEGAGCMTRGCAVRRACPVSRTYARQPAQSAVHMEAFAR